MIGTDDPDDDTVEDSNDAEAHTGDPMSGTADTMDMDGIPTPVGGPPLTHAGEPFLTLHRALVGDAGIEWYLLDPSTIPAVLREEVYVTWAWRVQTEYRSVQAMTRFLTEVSGAGDPIEILSGAADAIRDELRHTALCAGVVEALGREATLPTPVPEPIDPGFLQMPMAQRALVTAISMLLINETISVAMLGDLAARATHPTIKSVLKATMADEAGHQQFGWAYVAASLRRFDEAGRRYAAEVTAYALEEHMAPARALVGRLPAERQSLAAWAEPDFARYGLMSAEREALIKLQLHQRFLAPRLRAIGLIA
jgi:rubrerythrin